MTCRRRGSYNTTLHVKAPSGRRSTYRTSSLPAPGKPLRSEPRERNIDHDRRLTKPANGRFNWSHASTPIGNRTAGIRAARTIEILRTERGLTQRQLASHVTALGHPMSNTTLSRIERIQRRCDVDDLVVIIEALLVSPLMLLQRPTAT